MATRRKRKRNNMSTMQLVENAKIFNEYIERTCPNAKKKPAPQNREYKPMRRYQDYEL